MEFQVTSYKEHPNAEPGDLYQLKAIIIHRGGAYGGHYRAYIHDECEEGVWNLKVPEKYAMEPKPVQKVVNVGIEKSTTENPDKKDKKKEEEKEKELNSKTEVVELNFDECDFPFAYNNPKLQRGWFDFNDESVIPIPFGRLQTQFGGSNESAYMLIYKRKTLSSNYADPFSIPAYWKETILNQNEIYEKERITYKSEEAHLEVIFQDKSLFKFDEESMIKYIVDKGIENQGFKVKLKFVDTIGKLIEMFLEALKGKTGAYVNFDTIDIFEVNRQRNEYCQIIRSINSLSKDSTLENAKIEHESTWLFLQRANIEWSILSKYAGETYFPIEIVLRFLGDDVIFHTYKGITVTELKNIIFQRTSFPQEQQKIYFVESSEKSTRIDNKTINEAGKIITLFDLKLFERSQLLMEVNLHCFLI